MTLQEGIGLLGLTLPCGAEDRLTAFLALIGKWNKTYNLTAIRDPQEMVTHHLLDSLAALTVLKKSTPAGRQFRLVDVGSGAGLPGIVLAIAQPDWWVTLVDAVDKKAAFQRQVKIELGLQNLSIHCGRVERMQERFDVAISRAFASLEDFVRQAGQLADLLWAMKGEYPAEEIAALPVDWHLLACHELHVPGLAARRHLLQLEKN